mmetsp:Transcript_7380/g.18369  ORF Transcript_7380/g.18369 Transcript_7380/m.18369 type:complete len:217 (-) Transcript_7380:293-943(-)
MPHHRPGGRMLAARPTGQTVTERARPGRPDAAVASAPRRQPPPPRAEAAAPGRSPGPPARRRLGGCLCAQPSTPRGACTLEAAGVPPRENAPEQGAALRRRRRRRRWPPPPPPPPSLVEAPAHTAARRRARHAAARPRSAGEAHRTPHTPRRRLHSAACSEGRPTRRAVAHPVRGPEATVRGSSCRGHTRPARYIRRSRRTGRSRGSACRRARPVG